MIGEDGEEACSMLQAAYTTSYIRSIAPVYKTPIARGHMSTELLVALGSFIKSLESDI